MERWFVVNRNDFLLLSGVILCSPALGFILLDLWNKASDPYFVCYPGAVCLDFMGYCFWIVVFVIGFFCLLNSGWFPPGDGN